MKNFNRTTSIIMAACFLLPLSNLSHAEAGNKGRKLPNNGFVEAINDYETCEEVSFASEDEMVDPFIDIDIAKSIASLSEADQATAKKYLEELEQLTARTANEELISVDDEVRLEVLDRRLDDLFIEADVEYVEVDLLAKLSDENQLKAFQLMRKMESLESEEDIDKALIELDELIGLSESS